MAGASIDPGVIQHVARTVAFVEIPDNIIRVIFAIFDENRKIPGFFFYFIL